MKLHKGAWVGMVVVGMLAASAPSAMAANPVNWDTGTLQVDTTTSDAHWTSSAPLDAGYSQYNFSYNIYQADADTPLGWTNLITLGLVDPSELSGSGSFPTFPYTLGTDNFNQAGVTGDVSLSIDSSGYGHLDLTNFQFTGSITGLRAASTIDVTGVVPEPASLSMMALAGGLLLVRRRKDSAV